MISDVVWRYEVDGHGQFVASYISPVADRLLGLPAGTIGNSFDKYFSYVDPEDLPSVQETLSTALGTLAKDVTAEYRLRKPDGTTLWVRSKGSAYPQPDGHVVAFGTTSDITERKRAEEALRASEAKYRRLHESMRDAFVSVAMDGRILECNRTYQEMLGYEFEELTALTFMDLTPDKWHEFQAKLFQEQLLCGVIPTPMKRSIGEKTVRYSPWKRALFSSGMTRKNRRACGRLSATSANASRPSNGRPAC